MINWEEMNLKNKTKWQQQFKKLNLHMTCKL